MKASILLFGIVMMGAGWFWGYSFAMGKMFGDVSQLLSRVIIGKSESPVQVRAVASKYTWIFHYPGADGLFGETHHLHVSVANLLGLVPSDSHGADDFHSVELVLPCDTLIQVKTSSQDVIHSLGKLHGDFEVDAIPGVNGEGSFHSPAESKSGVLRCVQLCGPGFKDHHAPFRFIAKADFDQWFDGQSASVVVEE